MLDLNYLVFLLCLVIKWKWGGSDRELCVFLKVQKKPFRGVRRKMCLKNCGKFTGEQWCRSEVSIKLLCNFIGITLQHGCFHVNLLDIVKTLFPINTSGELILKTSYERIVFVLFYCFKVWSSVVLNTLRRKIFAWIYFCESFF